MYYAFCSTTMKECKILQEVPAVLYLYIYGWLTRQKYAREFECTFNCNARTCAVFVALFYNCHSCCCYFAVP